MESAAPSNEYLHAWRSRVNNAFIRTRRASLDRLLNISSELALNPVSEQFEGGQSQNIIAEIKQTINHFKEQAISPDGNHVDYYGLRKSDVYQQYRRQLTPKLRAIDLDDLGERKQANAFWINLYNALVIDGVIQAHVHTSVTEGFLGIVRFFNRSAYNVGGLRFSLEDIEHGILRANRGSVFAPGAHFPSDDPRNKYTMPDIDARLHFALNCASQSCPPIAVYSASELDQQLELATRNYLDHEVRLDTKKNRLWVSRIFKWYRSDFGGKEGVVSFLLEHLPKDERSAWLDAHRHTGNLYYLPYNWALNL